MTLVFSACSIRTRKGVNIYAGFDDAPKGHHRFEQNNSERVRAFTLTIMLEIQSIAIAFPDVLYKHDISLQHR